MKNRIINFLKWSQKYTGTDMTYATKGGFWWVFGKTSILFISFIAMIAFSNWLPKEDYGTYQFIIAGLSLCAIFTLPGIDTALIKSVAEKKEGTLQLAVGEKMKWGTIGVFLSLGWSGWYFSQGNNLLATAFLLGAIFIPFKETFLIFFSFWNGRKRFDLQARYDMISVGLSTLLLILAIYLTNNVLVIIFVFMASHTFLNWLFYQKTKKQAINQEKDQQAIFFGKKLSFINALQTGAIYLDKIIIWNFLGAVPVAIYSFAELPIEKIKTLIPIIPLALPKLGENKIDGPRKRGIISKFLRLFAVSIPAALILALMAPFLYRLFFPQYMESVVYFQALSALIAISPFLLLLAVLVTEMKTKALYAVSMGTPLLKIILFFALIPIFGIWGIIIAILVAELLRGLLTLYFFLKI